MKKLVITTMLLLSTLCASARTHHIRSAADEAAQRHEHTKCNQILALIGTAAIIVTAVALSPRSATNTPIAIHPERIK